MHKYFNRRFPAAAIKYVPGLLMLALCILPSILWADSKPVPSRYPQGYWGLPDQGSSYAPEIDKIFMFILYITGFVFVAVEGLLVIFLFKYRYQKGRVASYTHGNNRLEIIWTAIPAVILVALAIFSNTVWSDIRSPNKFPKDATTIHIDPRQFEWDITYPGPDGQFGTKDDIKTINQLYLVKDAPVQIKLQGQDVIHSFFVPEFRIKQDAVPGMPTAVWIKPTMGGAFEIACAELCGLGHYRMKGDIQVVSQDSVNSWLKMQAASQ